MLKSEMTREELEVRLLMYRALIRAYYFKMIACLANNDIIGMRIWSLMRTSAMVNEVDLDFELYYRFTRYEMYGCTANI